MVLDKSQEALFWLEECDEAQKVDYQQRLKELAGICDPILFKPLKPLKKGFLSNEKTTPPEKNAQTNVDNKSPNNNVAGNEGNNIEDAKMDVEAPETKMNSD